MNQENTAIQKFEKLANEDIAANLFASIERKKFKEVKKFLLAPFIIKTKKYLVICFDDGDVLLISAIRTKKLVDLIIKNLRKLKNKNSIRKVRP